MIHVLQGEDAVHDAIRQQQLAVGATGRILAALKEWGAENEEVLWAVLFSLAVLVRDGANPFQPAIRAVAAAGIPPLLSCALQSYKVFATGVTLRACGYHRNHTNEARKICSLLFSLPWHTSIVKSSSAEGG